MATLVITSLSSAKIRTASVLLGVEAQVFDFRTARCNEKALTEEMTVSTKKINQVPVMQLVRAWQLPASFYRYALVGLLQNGAFYLVALVLIAFGWTAWQTVLLLNPVAVALTFFINRNWSFSRGASSGQLAEGWRYLVVYATAYPLSIAFTWMLEWLGTPPQLAAIINVGVSAIGIYFALRWWVFPVKPERQESNPSSVR